MIVKRFSESRLKKAESCPVSLREICGFLGFSNYTTCCSVIPNKCRPLPFSIRFLGIPYVGNVLARLKAIVLKAMAEASGGEDSGAARLRQLLQPYDRGGVALDGARALQFEDVESFFSTIGVFEEITHAHVRKVLSAFPGGKVRMEDLVKLFYPTSSEGSEINVER